MLALRYFTFCLHVPRKTHDISSLYPRKIHAKKSRDFRNSTLLSVTDHNISLRVLYLDSITPTLAKSKISSL